MIERLRFAWMAVSIVLLTALCLTGQDTTGRINGVITDGSGASIPSASVTVTNTNPVIEGPVDFSAEAGDVNATIIWTINHIIKSVPM